MAMDKHKKLVSSTKRKDGWIKAYDLHYELENGSAYIYEMVSRRDIRTPEELSASHVDAIQIVPIFADGDVLVSHEFRYPINARAYGFCSGLVDAGESASEAAARELAEETGLSVVEVLGELPAAYSTDGMSDENLSIVFALVEGTPKDTCGTEDIRSEKMPVDKALAIAMNPANAMGSRFQLIACLLAALSSSGDMLGSLRRLLNTES